MAQEITFTPNFKAAAEFTNSLRKSADRSYAQRLIGYYRDYGKRPVSAPSSSAVSSAQVTRIGNMIRHLLVGDCTPNGSLIDPATGKRL